MNHQRTATHPPGKRTEPRLAASETDPDLAFMLAHQALNRLQFELHNLSDQAAAGKDPEFTRYERDIAINQVDALENRMRPFTSFIDQAIRFEAQEIILALGGIRQNLVQIAQPQEQEQVRSHGAADVAARLMARRA